MADNAENIRYENPNNEPGESSFPLGSTHFTNQNPFMVTADDLTKNWSGRGRKAFGCSRCMTLFGVGDIVRWVSIPRGAPNIFVCRFCDGPTVRADWVTYWKDVVRPILDRWADG